jgi:hypothetical protein
MPLIYASAVLLRFIATTSSPSPTRRGTKPGEVFLECALVTMCGLLMVRNGKGIIVAWVSLIAQKHQLIQKFDFHALAANLLLGKHIS